MNHICPRWQFADGGACGTVDTAVTLSDTLWIEQDITSSIPFGARLIAQLYLDGEVLAESFPASVLPPRGPQFEHFLRFTFPQLVAKPQHYGVRYIAVFRDGRRVTATLEQC